MEHVVYVIPNVSYRRSFLRSAGANLVLTDERVIVAHITSEVIKETQKEAGGGFGGYMASLLGNYRNRYLGMEPEMIMKESSDNFSIPLSEISEVKIKAGDHDRGILDEIELRGRRNMKFKGRTGTLNQREIKDAFSGVGLKVKGGGFFK